MNAGLISGDHFAEVHPGDPLYRDLQLRGYNRRFVGTPDSVFVVDDTDQVVKAVDAIVASGKKLAVRSGGHCTEGFVDDPAVQCVIDLSQMDSVYYDRQRRAFAVEAGATLGRVYQKLDMGWGVTLPGGIGTAVGMGGHVSGGCFVNWPDPDLLEEEWNQSGVPWSVLYYGENYKKLQEAKRRWDPRQVFNHAMSVEPG